MAVDEHQKMTVDQEVIVISGPHKSQRKKLRMTLVVLVVLGVIAVVIGVLLTTGPKNSPRYPEVPSYGSAQALVDAATPLLRAKVIEPAKVTGLGGTTSEGITLFSPPLYRPSNTSFDVLPTKSSGLAVTGEATITEADYMRLIGLLENSHFKKTTMGNGDAYVSFFQQATITRYVVYASDTMVCAVMRADVSQTHIKNYITTIACSMKAIYDESAKNLTPFYAAYIKADDEKKARNLVFGDAVVSDGDAGYKNAVVYQEDQGQTTSDDDRVFFRGLYYKKPSDKDWTFFVGERGLLSCAEYQSEIIVKAFKNRACYDDDLKTLSTVK